LGEKRHGVLVAFIASVEEEYDVDVAVQGP